MDKNKECVKCGYELYKECKKEDRVEYCLSRCEVERSSVSFDIYEFEIWIESRGGKRIWLSGYDIERLYGKYKKVLDDVNKRGGYDV